LTSGYEVINISRDWNFDEQGIFVVDSLTFYVFDKEENGDKTLIYECTLDADNNWQVDNGYVDVSFDVFGNNLEFCYPDGRHGTIHYSIYQPIAGIYMEESSYSLNDYELFSVKNTYSSLFDCIKVQGHVHGYKIMLNDSNNWMNIFDNGIIIQTEGTNIYYIGDGTGGASGPPELDGLPGISEGGPPNGGGSSCGFCTYCACWDYPPM